MQANCHSARLCACVHSLTCLRACNEVVSVLLAQWQALIECHFKFFISSHRMLRFFQRLRFTIAITPCFSFHTARCSITYISKQCHSRIFLVPDCLSDTKNQLYSDKTDMTIIDRQLRPINNCHYVNITSICDFKNMLKCLSTA